MLCTANIKDVPGTIKYTQMLNKDGGIETDLTVVCIDQNHFRIISSAATRERDKFHIKKHLSDDVELTDITDDYCVFGIFGPKSRLLMQDLSSDDFSNENFKFANSKYIEIDGTKNKSKLGANAILGTSLAISHAGAGASEKTCLNI